MIEKLLDAVKEVLVDHVAYNNLGSQKIKWSSLYRLREIYEEITGKIIKEKCVTCGR